MKTTLILTVGLPQSGKSTWARDRGLPIVNRDSIRKAITGDQRDHTQEKHVNRVEEVMVEALAFAGLTDIIIDATHLKASYRTRWNKFAEERGYVVHEQKFKTALDTCLLRAQRNYPDEPVFIKAIVTMWRKYGNNLGIPEKQCENWVF